MPRQRSFGGKKKSLPQQCKKIDFLFVYYPTEAIAIDTNLKLHKKVLSFYQTFGQKAFENIVCKGENAGNQHIFPFRQCFLFFQRHVSTFESHFIH